MGTQVAVQSGQTVLLGGLIQQDESNTDTGIPGLNRIPWLGRLFGTTNRSKDRTELIVLITPRVIRGGEDARQVTDDYEDKFQSLAPLRATNGQVSAAVPVVTPLPTQRPSWTLQLQEHAESALQHGDYAMAQDLAMQSWQQGLRYGPLCERNWQVMLDARQHNGTLGSVDDARKHQQICLSAATP